MLSANSLLDLTVPQEVFFLADSSEERGLRVRVDRDLGVAARGRGVGVRSVQERRSSAKFPLWVRDRPNVRDSALSCLRLSKYICKYFSYLPTLLHFCNQLKIPANDDTPLILLII